MTTTLGPASSRNLSKTYFALGATMPGARIFRDEGFTVCEGDLPHPLCNFAAELNLDPWSARRLREYGEGRPTFHAYLCPGDRPEHADELLVRAGFTSRYSMHMMAAEPLHGECDLEEALTSEERRSVAQFMGSQFFQRQPEGVRSKVIDATAEAEGLRLFQLKLGALTIGAVMLCESPGVVGVYNLCILPPQRGKGLAGGILTQVRRLAGQTGAHVVLQCEPRLTAFYARHDFVEIGLVRVFEPPKREGSL